jgi:hypothetical protein
MSTKLVTRISAKPLRVLFVVGLTVGFVFATLCAHLAYTPSFAGALTDYTVYLPLIEKNYVYIPAAPVLYSISNEDGDGNYTVSWSSSVGASSYSLQEATNANFSNATTAYSGSNTSQTFNDKAVGTYYYRVRAANENGSSEWSNIQQVTVSPPMVEVNVENNTGGQLCFRIDNTGIGEKCFSSGTYYYGTFPSGTYTWYASALCGSASETQYYEPGVFTHQFWCE